VLSRFLFYFRRRAKNPQLEHRGNFPTSEKKTKQKKFCCPPVKNLNFGNAAKIKFLHKVLSRVPKLWKGTVYINMLCYVSIYIAPFPLVSKCSKALFSSLSRCDTHHSMFKVMFLESNHETELACSRYRALPTIFMTGSAGIWTQGLITSWLML
jgi:hypothetical protein